MMVFNNILLWFCFVALVMTKNEQQFFTKEPSDVSATQGEKVTLPCQVENKGGVLQWTRDGFGLGQNRSLPGFPRMSMVGSNAAKDWDLEISPVLLEDEAVYQCQVLATGEMHPIRSRTARLIVMIPSGLPVIRNGPLVTMTEGKETNLSCHAEGGKPAAQLEWRVDGVNIKNIQTKTEKIPRSLTFKTISHLTLVPTKSDDGLTISCLISSTDKSSEVVISVMHKPDVKLSRVKEKNNIVEGENVVFNCDSSARPSDVLYTWMVDDEEKIHAQAQQNFQIGHITRQFHNSRVTCMARNKIGVGQDQELLKIFYGPRIILHPISQSANEDKTVELECDADGNPKPSISWFKVNTTESLGTGRVLAFNLSKATIGSYYCTADSTMFTTVDTSHIARVSITTGPAITSPQDQLATQLHSQTEVRCVADTSAQDTNVTWSFKGDKITPGGKYFIENIVKEDQFESILSISETEEDDFGYYQCIVENAIGRDSKEILLTLHLEGVFNDVLLLQIFLGTAGLLTCILTIFAVRRFCQSLQHSFGEVSQRNEDEEEFRSEMYRDKVLREIMENNKETKVMSKHAEYETDDQDVIQGHVLHTINMDYAAFYGNHHLSNNLAEDDSEEEEEQDGRIFSNHPYLVT